MKRYTFGVSGTELQDLSELIKVVVEIEDLDYIVVDD